jgi:hypothetical protein
MVPEEKFSTEVTKSNRLNRLVKGNEIDAKHVIGKVFGSIEKAKEVLVK